MEALGQGLDDIVSEAIPVSGEIRVTHSAGFDLEHLDAFWAQPLRHGTRIRCVEATHRFGDLTNTPFTPRNADGKSPSKLQLAAVTADEIGFGVQVHSVDAAVRTVTRQGNQWCVEDFYGGGREGGDEGSKTVCLHPTKGFQSGASSFTGGSEIRTVYSRQP